jgi:hypothetical protein
MMRKFLNSGALITAVGVWGGLTTAAVAAVVLIGGRSASRAVIKMALGLVLLWIVLGGLLTRRLRDPLRAVVQNLRLDWRIKFVLLCTLLALIEEAVTVSMTNLAPAFGVPPGAAYITASANYLDVVCLHSVVVFVPMFIGWAWLLNRYAFSPNAVFLLFGLTGTLADVSFGGAQQLLAFGFWTFVYGLMVYLPAYACLPSERAAIQPRPWHYLLAVFLPDLFVLPVAAGLHFIHPVKIHFPPIPPNS